MFELLFPLSLFFFFFKVEKSNGLVSPLPRVKLHLAVLSQIFLDRLAFQNVLEQCEGACERKALLGAAETVPLQGSLDAVQILDQAIL